MAVVPARWLVGPPPPRVLTLFTRVLQVCGSSRGDLNIYGCRLSCYHHLHCSILPSPPAHTLQLACFVVCSVWVFSCLGGLRLSPKPTGEGSNDTRCCCATVLWPCWQPLPIDHRLAAAAALRAALTC